MSAGDALAVVQHERTGKYYVVGEGGATVIGPFEPHEILRHWRLAAQPSDRPGVAKYREHYNPAPPPFPPAEARPLSPLELPPSVTRHQFPKTTPDIEWFSPQGEARETLMTLANTGKRWLTSEQAVFGRVARGTELWGHPADAVLICRRPLPGEQVAVVEFAPTR